MDDCCRSNQHCCNSLFGDSNTIWIIIGAIIIIWLLFANDNNNCCC